MFLYLVLLFTIVPVIELAILISVGRHIGLINTISIVLLTGVAGALLAKSQGLMILKKMQQDLNMGRMPADKMIDGVMILCGGLLLLTPGFITDFIGFMVLIPYTRHLIKKLLKDKIKKQIQYHHHIDYKP